MQYAVNARKTLQYEEINTTLEKNRAKHLLLFVYDSRERFSQIAGEMMMAFIEDTAWKVIGVSIDQGKTLGISAVRSAFCFSAQRGKINGIIQ